MIPRTEPALHRRMQVPHKPADLSPHRGVRDPSAVRAQQPATPSNLETPITAGGTHAPSERRPNPPREHAAPQNASLDGESAIPIIPFHEP